MKAKKLFAKSLAVVLCLAMAFSLVCITASAESKAPVSGKDYTTVLVHGLLGWGDEDGLSNAVSIWGLTSGNMPRYLTNQGYDVFVASIGPVSSAHDRCCELFAQLTGSRVDYGMAHAAKCTDEYAALGYSLKHGRYGRDYTGAPKIKNWGPIYDQNGKVTGWYDNKINLVGHSFGGPTALEFLELLAKGDEAERNWGKEQAALLGGDWHDYVSPLFWGDYNGEYLVNSVTSLAGVLNGTTFITANDDAMSVMTKLLMLMAEVAGNTSINKIYDFQLEQFGITKIPDSAPSAGISYLQSLGFTAGSDNAFFDLTTNGTNLLKKGWETYDNVYYFSYACNKSYKAGGAYMPKIGMMFLLYPFSATMGSYKDPNELVFNIDGSLYGGIDAEWMPNDGMVNTVSSRYPLGAPHKPYNVNSISSGIWNVHPDLDEDHFSIVGSFITPDPIGTKKLFLGVMQDIEKTKPITDKRVENLEAQQNRLAAPVIVKTGTSLFGKPVIDFKAVSGAYLYNIYRATEENGDYGYIDNTILSSFTDRSAKSGKTYYYKVVAVPLSARYASSYFSAPASVKAK